MPGRNCRIQEAGEGTRRPGPVSYTHLIGALARLKLIFKTNVRQSIGAAQWEASMKCLNAMLDDGGGSADWIN